MMNPGILTSLIGLGINNMQDRIGQERLQAVNQAFNLSTKTLPLNRGFYGPGGAVLSSESDYVPAQMDKGETFVTPSLKIYKSKSKKKHEDMDKSKITDLIKNESFAFSERKFFTPEDYGGDILGYGFAHYEEEEDFELEEVKLKDVFKDPTKEISFSEGAGEIAKYFGTKGDNKKNTDIFDKITNQENIQARAPYISKLIELHRGNKEEVNAIMPQQFGYGGKVKKYENGGDAIMKKMYEDELARLDELDDTNDQMFLMGGIQGAQATMGNRLNNIAGLSIDTIGTALQDAQVDPALVDTSMADGMFEEISNATADQIANTGFGRANSLISNVAARNPEVARRMAPSLLAGSVGASNDARLSIVKENLAQRRGRYSFLNNANNLNRQNRMAAQEATDDLVNRKIAGLSAAGNRFLTNESFINSSALDYNRANMGQLNTNRIATSNRRTSLLGDKMNYDVQREAQRQTQRMFEEMIKRNNRGATNQNSVPTLGGSMYDSNDTWNPTNQIYSPLPGANNYEPWLGN